jgi:NAD(P)-dependent dehydrogenase (short-subunit alcohol dehydrogenase family)
MDGSMGGKIVIVTGANAGIGKATAAAIADKGAKVILACRSKERGEAALSDLRCVKSRDVELMHIDLADLESVRVFAGAFCARYGRLDALVNNAGILARMRNTTRQGFELSFGVNYLGHFLLTLLLLPLLERAGQGRVIMMSSVAHAWTGVRFDDLNFTHGYNRFLAYGHSKLCNLLFARALAEKLRQKGSRVTINAVHPGIVASDIVVNRKTGAFRWVAALMHLFFLSCGQGAEPSVYLACDPAASAYSGEYFSRLRIEPGSEASRDLAAANRLYTLSLGFAGLKEDSLC